MAAPSKKFSEEVERSRASALEMLAVTAGDPQYWKKLAYDAAGYANIYHDAVGQWLEAMLLYNWPGADELAREFLLPAPPYAMESVDCTTSMQHRLLEEYFFDRATVGLVAQERLSEALLKTSTGFHLSHIASYGYTSDEDLVDREGSAETVLGRIVAEFLRRLAIGSSFESVTTRIGKSGIGTGQIWKNAWELLFHIHDKELCETSLLDTCWETLLATWRDCFLNSNFFSFYPEYLVMCNYLYCRATKRSFAMSQLSRDLLVGPGQPPNTRM